MEWRTGWRKEKRENGGREEGKKSERREDKQEGMEENKKMERRRDINEEKEIERKWMRVGSEKEIDVERWYKSIERDIAQKIIRQKYRHREIEEWIEKRKHERSQPSASPQQRWEMTGFRGTLDARRPWETALLSNFPHGNENRQFLLYKPCYLYVTWWVS